MTTPTWTDCTTYRQGDKERVPTIFKVRSGKLQIVVTNGHIYCKGEWIMHCDALGINTQPLKEALTREQAQAFAWKRVESKLAELQADLEAIPYQAIP